MRSRTVYRCLLCPTIWMSFAVFMVHLDEQHPHGPVDQAVLAV